MLAYAIRFKIDEIILFYPNTVLKNQEESTEIIIKDALANGKEISIKAFQLPILNTSLLERKFESKTDLNGLFESTKIDLIKRIEEILVPQSL